MLELKFKPVIVVAILQLLSNIASNVTITLQKNWRIIFLNDFLGLLMILLLKIVELDMKNRDTPQVSYTEEIQWKMKYNTNPSCLQCYTIFQALWKNSNASRSFLILGNFAKVSYFWELKKIFLRTKQMQNDFILKGPQQKVD